jgi:hypothetical protein
MRDMNDMYVNDHCPTKVHCRGYVFTISELFDLVQIYCSNEKLAAHEDTEKL